MVVQYTPISIKVASEKNDAWSMFHSQRVHYCSKSSKNSKFCTRNEARNLESKRCWHFYAMSAERHVRQCI